MGKGGKKSKSYKPPDEKYVVVSNPWGDGRVGAAGISKPPIVNNIGAWFELMLKDQLKPGYKPVISVYYQRTHRNIIVELHPDIDIVPCLGAHEFSRFVAGNRDPGTSFIYEYNYELFGDPSSGWICDHPAYTEIHPRFPVITPYPPALLAPEFPTLDVRWAKKLSFEVTERILERLRPTINGGSSTISGANSTTQFFTNSVSVGPSRDPKRHSTSESMLPPTPRSPPNPTNARNPAKEQVFSPYESPDPYPGHTKYPSVNKRNEESPESYPAQHRSSTVDLPPRIKPEPQENAARVKKLDPYDETDVSTARLRSVDTGVKQEQGSSLFSATVKKEDSMQHQNEHNIQQQRRSMTLSTPPPTALSRDDRYGVKHEPWDEKVKMEKNEENYEPSEELMKAFASLPPETLQNSDRPSVPRSEYSGKVSITFDVVPVKNEDAYVPSKDLIKAFESLPPDAFSENRVAPTQKHPEAPNHSHGRVGRSKPEPVETNLGSRDQKEGRTKYLKRSPSTEYEGPLKKIKTELT